MKLHIRADISWSHRQGYIDDLMEMYESCSDEQGKKWDLLVGNPEETTYEQFKEWLGKLEDSALVKVVRIIHAHFEQGDGCLIDKT